MSLPLDRRVEDEPHVVPACKEYLRTYYYREILIIGGYLLLEDTYYYRDILIIGGSVAISSVIKVTMEQSGKWIFMYSQKHGKSLYLQDVD